jgi:hypothetical protein
VKGGRQVGNRGRWGRLWSEGAGDAARASKRRALAGADAPPPAHRKTGGGGLIMTPPLGFFPGRGGFSWKSHPAMACYDLLAMPPKP